MSDPGLCISSSQSEYASKMGEKQLPDALIALYNAIINIILESFLQKQNFLCNLKDLKNMADDILLLLIKFDNSTLW